MDGSLAQLYTDYWAGNLVSALPSQKLGKSFSALASRKHEGLPDMKVTSWKARAIYWEFLNKYFSLSGNSRERYLGYCELGRRFSLAIKSDLEKQAETLVPDVYFGYDTCSLEVMASLKSKGVKCVLDQIDPGKVEIDMVNDELKAWPGWQSEPLDVPGEFYDRHHSEWDAADRVLVNSAFSKRALIEQGVERNKLLVIPLCYEPVSQSYGIEEQKYLNFGESLRCRWSNENPLRVLYLGQVMLRKGIQYLIEAAKKLTGFPVVFDIVGPIHISQSAVDSAGTNVIFHGRVTRDEIDRWYQTANVFLLPTLSDGFAITQIEAMSNGLPVVTTANCGEVVSHNKDGLIIPIRNSRAIVDAVVRYLDEPDSLKRHSSAAMKKAKTFDLESLSANLSAIGETLIGADN
jgi:glycosyltransferase involved in cell wall biosynthesis